MKRTQADKLLKYEYHGKDMLQDMFPNLLVDGSTLGKGNLQQMVLGSVRCYLERKQMCNDTGHFAWRRSSSNNFFGFYGQNMFPPAELILR